MIRTVFNATASSNIQNVFPRYYDPNVVVHDYLGDLVGLDALIAFGEWCHARHTVSYDALPDWFLLFDVFDRAAGAFWSRERRDAFAAERGLHVAPLLGQGRQTRKALEKLLASRSRVGSAQVEGVYLRWDRGDWLAARAKVVREGWVMADDEHWSARPLEMNRLAGAMK